MRSRLRRRSLGRLAPALAAAALLVPTSVAADTAYGGDRPNVAVSIGLGSIAFSLERGCPPPGLLACRPGVRVVASVPPAVPETVREAAIVATVRAVRAFGYRDLIKHEAPGAFRGRISAHGEPLARWRQDGRFAEIAIGGLELLTPAQRRTELASGPGLRVDVPVLQALAHR